MDMSRCPRQGEADARARMSFDARIAILFTVLGGCLLASDHVAAQSVVKTGDSVRVTADQMQQLSITRVASYPFRVQKFAIGQIAYNEDTSTAVLAPFSGRVVRLIAKVGDRVKRGEPSRSTARKWCSRRTISSPPSQP